MRLSILWMLWGSLILILSANAQIFDPNVRVDDGSSASSRHLSDLTSTPEGNLFCVWSDNSSGADNVYVSKSPDGGQSWSSPFRLNDNQQPRASSPSITSDDSGNLYVVWLAGPDSTRILFTCSRNNGNRWLTPNVRVDDGTTSIKSSPDIAVDREDNIFVVWRDKRRGDGFDIYSSHSGNWGFSWSEPDLRVSDNEPVTFRDHPALCAWGDGQLAAVWADDREVGDVNIYFAHSSDSGNSFSIPNLPVNSAIPGDQLRPDIAYHGGTIYVTYFNTTDLLNSDIYFNRSDDFGHSWLQSEVMVNPVGETSAVDPKIAVSSPENVGVAWAVNLYHASTFDLFFSRSHTNGDTWSEALQVNDDGQGSYQHGEPALIFGPEAGVNISFFDYREGEPHIYFASEKTTGVPDGCASPKEIFLLGSYPNPFNSTAEIIYRLPRVGSSSKLSVRVFDPTGRLIRTLLDGETPRELGGGTNRICWDGKDNSGVPLSSGVYLLKLKCDRLEETLKITLIR